MTTLTDRVRNHLSQAIRRGDLALGDRLPSPEALGRQLGCSDATVRKALVILAREGLVKRVQRMGTIVARHPDAGRVVMVLSDDYHFNGLLANPISEALQNQGFTTDLVPLVDDKAVFANRCRALRKADAQATVAVALQPLGRHETASRWYWRALDAFQHRVCVALYGRNVHPDEHLVSIDYIHGSRLVAEHLWQAGHRKAAVFEGTDIWGQDVARSFQTIWETLGGACTVLPAYVAPAERLRELTSEAGVTAFWAFNDHTAVTLYTQLAELRLKVPADVSVVGRNDTLWAVQCATPLTTLSISPSTVAQTVVRLADQFMQAPAEVAGGTTLITPELVARESTGVAASPRPRAAAAGGGRS